MTAIQRLALDEKDPLKINSAINQLAEYIDRAGNAVLLNGAVLATNATTGFLYIPTCAGTPTGVPVAQTGTVALVYDTTNHKLYIYDGAWKGGTTPGAFT